MPIYPPTNRGWISMPPQSYLQFAFGQEKGKMTVMSTALLPQYDQPSKVFTTVKQRKE